MAFVVFFLLGIFPIQEMLFFSFVVLCTAFCFALKKKEKKSVFPLHFERQITVGRIR
jgi:hypothetical protein